jgi:hypothetical protein
MPARNDKEILADFAHKRVLITHPATIITAIVNKTRAAG